VADGGGDQIDGASNLGQGFLNGAGDPGIFRVDDARQLQRRFLVQTASGAVELLGSEGPKFWFGFQSDFSRASTTAS
jgi:hypothetical protein